MQLNIFGKKHKSFGSKTQAAVIGDIAKEHFNGLGLSTESRSLLGRAFLSTEGFTQADRDGLSEVGAVSENTATAISTAYADETGQALNDDQVEALRESIVISQDPEGYIKSASEHDKDVVIPSIGGEAEVGPVDAELSKESFEVHNMMNTLAMTVSYNIRPEKQSKAVELFFPTISLDSTQNNYTIDTHLSTVFNSQEYALNGKGDAYRNQKHVIKALRNHNILKSNFTDVVPVFRVGENEDNFVDSTLLPPHVVKTDFGEEINTSLLKVGTEVKVLAISQTDRMIALGMQDDTDQLSANPRLKTLGLKVGDDVVLFENLQYHQASQWTYSPIGDREDIQLLYNVNTHVLNADTVGVKSGTLPAELQALKDKKLEVLVQFNVVGQGNTDLAGKMTVTPSAVKVKAIRNAETKEVLSLNTAENKALVEAVEKTAIVGFAVDATRTNSNLREHGLLLDDRVQRIIYGVRLHSPIAIRRPMDDKDTVSDSQRIDSLIRLSFIRRTNAGITALYDLMNMLKAQPKHLDTAEPFAFSAIGVGQYFARTYQRDLNLDIFKTTQSMQSTDVLKNVSAVMTNFILAEMTQAYCSSELAAAYELSDIGGAKPHVIALADVYTSKFIFREGDARTLGDGFKFTLEECSDIRLLDGKEDGEIGTIFLSFGKPEGANMNVPLWFGNTLDKREIPRIVSRSRGSKYQHETMVQPWFSHICHLPVLVRITVQNLKKAVQERIPFEVVEKTAADKAANP